MMPKTLLSVLTAGIIGCGGSYNVPKVVLPVDIKQNEMLLFKNEYKTNYYNESEVCTNSVYAGFEKNALRSVLEVKHCYVPKENKGNFYWTRSEDTDGDGLVDKDCQSFGYSYLGGRVEDNPQCFSWIWRTQKITSILEETLRSASNP